MEVRIVGTGYVGLVGACLAESGNDVVCRDLDEPKVADLKSGDVPIYEPGLEPLIEGNLAAGRLSFTTDGVACVGASDVLFITVDTPSARTGPPTLRLIETGKRAS